MGGSKARDVPSNIIVICSWLNSAIESNAELADEARDFGWKLRLYQDPASEPVYYPLLDTWVLLDNKFGQTELGG